MTRTRTKVVIIGGGQAGGRLAQLLVNSGAPFEVTLVCGEPHPPYQRPPLSKDILLATATLDDCLIWTSSDIAWNAVDLRIGVSAESIDRQAKTVRLDDGAVVNYDCLVFATGSRVRRLSVPGSELGNVHCLRSIDQAENIASVFGPGKKLIVVGGGFIGLEIAASARTRGLDITVVEASDRLLSRVVPPRVSELLARRHEAEGVRLLKGIMVERFISNGRGVVKSAQLSTGDTLACDIAVVGVGVAANVELAAAAGLDINVGILTDSQLRTSDPSIFACGDVATFRHPLYERDVRVEAFQNAEDHARVIADVLGGGDAVCDTVPFFWSDQYDLSLQIAGLPHLGSSVVVRKLDGGAEILFHLTPDGRIVGATGLGRSGSIGRDIRLSQVLIDERACPDRSVLMDPDSRLKSLVGRDASTPLVPPAIAGRSNPRPMAEGA